MVATISRARWQLALGRPRQARFEILRNPARQFSLLRSLTVAPQVKPGKTKARRKPFGEYLRKRDFARTPEPQPESRRRMPPGPS